MTRTKKIIMANLMVMGLIALSIAFIDKPLAVFIDKHLNIVKPFFYNFTLALDQLATYIFWPLVSILILGFIFLVKRSTKKMGFILITLVLANLSASIITNVLKTEFKRARPEVYLEAKSNTADFQNIATKDYSFPSSHTSFYLSLFLPAAILFRRYAPLLLFIPAIIIIGRIVQNEHYVSDVLCSIILVFNLCISISGLLYLVDNKMNSNRRKLQQTV